MADVSSENGVRHTPTPRSAWWLHPRQQGGGAAPGLPSICPPITASQPPQRCASTAILKSQVSSVLTSNDSWIPAAQTSADQGTTAGRATLRHCRPRPGSSERLCANPPPTPRQRESGLTHGRQEPSQAFRGKLPGFIRQASSHSLSPQHESETSGRDSWVLLLGTPDAGLLP